MLKSSFDYGSTRRSILTIAVLLGTLTIAAPSRQAQAQGLFGSLLPAHRYTNRAGQNIGVNGTPVGIGDLRWGMNHKDLQKMYKDSGMTTMDVPDHMLSYVVPFTWPGAKYKYVMQVWFIDDQLRSVIVGAQDETDKSDYWGRPDIQDVAAELSGFVSKTWPGFADDNQLTQTLDKVTLYQTKQEYAGMVNGITGYNKVFDHWQPPMMRPDSDGVWRPDGPGDSIYRDEPIYGKVASYNTVITKQWDVPFDFTLSDTQWTPLVPSKKDDTRRSNGVIYRFAVFTGKNIGIVRFQAERDLDHFWNRGLTAAQMKIEDSQVRENVLKNYSAYPTDRWAKSAGK